MTLDDFAVFLSRHCPQPAAPLFAAYPAPPRVLITGAQGFLGVRLGAFFSACPSGGAPSCSALSVCGRTALDLTRAEQVQQAVAAFAPDIVFHCAAVSDTGQAQREPELSYTVNVTGTLHVAAACRAAGAKLVVMSSDQVYNGTHLPGDPPLAETAPLTPENVYGAHKLEAEQRGLALLPDAVFLRLTWMYDALNTPFRQSSNLLYNLQQAAQTGIPARFATRERRGITDVWQVVRALPAAAGFPGGVYNFGSENTLSAYDTARKTAALLGLPENTAQPDETRFAPHGRNLAMDTAKARAVGAVFPDTLAGIAQAVRAHEV